MPTIYHPSRPHASPLWQIVTAAWEAFVAGYEKIHLATMGPLRPNVFAVVRNFLRGGDRGCGVPPQAVDGASRAANSNAAATTPPACHQRRARQTADWITACVSTKSPTASSSSPSPKSCAVSSESVATAATSCSKRRPTPCWKPATPASTSPKVASPPSSTTPACRQAGPAQIQARRPL
ncbi:MAG: hypothetical protein NTW21_25260 [Verrucomicrobia bacterium]|nr:hypothetical protein [Verrucomicrobiota bacterium]